MNEKRETVRKGPLAAHPNGKDEMNLAEFPITLLGDRIPRGLKTIESDDQFFDERTGRVIVRRRVITGSDKYGLPTAKDDEVILGLIQLTKDANNFTDRTVNFSRGELIELIAWPRTGPSFRRVTRSLNCWVDVGLHYEKAWYDNAHKSWVDEHFHIIERVSLYDSQGQAAQPFLKLSSFTWSEPIFRSFQAGYLKRFDLDFYLGLESATAKRLYRFLDKRFYLKPNWDFDLQDLAYNHIGLSRSGYEGNGHLAKKLRPAIEELEAKGFLEPLTEQARFERRSRSEWRVVFVRGKKTHRDRPSLDTDASVSLAARKQKPEPPAPESPPLAQELINRGVTASTARELVATYPEEQIRRQLEQTDWLKKKTPNKITNVGAYLAQAIREDFAVPPGFESPADRQKRREAEAAKRHEEREEARRRRAEEARARGEQVRILEYWNALDSAEQRRLEAEALEQANESAAQSYRELLATGNPVAPSVLRCLREAHLRKLLGFASSDAPAQ